MTNCPALLIAAPASGQGKTTVTAALARLHARQGKRVRVFKCGPDFLDPQILSVASGSPVYNLDLGMCGAEDAALRLADAAANANLILVEGVMGLFDGKPSAADVACRFNIPVLGLIDASAMAQTFGAVAHGLANFRLTWSGTAHCRAMPKQRCRNGTSAYYRRRKSALGTQITQLPEGKIKEHTFHYSKSETSLTPLVRARKLDGKEGVAIYRRNRLTASYVHFYFPSNPQAVAALFTT